jgi:ferric-dicitrate binding protein FerR (iron transport regulator)
VVSLNEYAVTDKTSTGYQPWRKKSEENMKAWEEAVKGYQEDSLPISTIVRWLQTEKKCPLSDSTIRGQLKSSLTQIDG